MRHDQPMEQLTVVSPVQPCVCYKNARSVLIHVDTTGLSIAWSACGPDVPNRRVQLNGMIFRSRELVWAFRSRVLSGSPRREDPLHCVVNRSLSSVLPECLVLNSRKVTASACGPPIVLVYVKLISITEGFNCAWWSVDQGLRSRRKARRPNSHVPLMPCVAGYVEV